MKSDQEFWKRKLLAFLHDPPCKPLDLRRHEEIAWQFCKGENISEEEKELFNSIKDADHMASAADRMSFKRSVCSNKFTGKPGQTFKHPLCGTELQMNNLPTLEYAVELLQNAVGGVKAPEGENYWKNIFFLYWRRWMENAAEADSATASMFPYYPAETRLPDHSIWHHMSLASALQGCRNSDGKIKPSFLLFTLGPVQSFIAQARSTRDLWSGSYMLSWLTSRAMKAVADINGPDSVIFPSLRGQPVFDVQYRDELYSKIMYKDDSLWKRMYNDGTAEEKEASAKKLLTPTLPNRFLAVLPEEKAEEAAAAAEKAVFAELNRISEACFRKFTEAAGKGEASWKRRWDRQVALFPKITWTVLPWDDDVDDTLRKFEKLPINSSDSNDENKPAGNLRQVIKLSKKSGYHDDGSPLNIGSVWSAHYAITEFCLSARKNTREFEQFVTDESQFGTLKDALSGKEEIIGDEGFWDFQENTSDDELGRNPKKLFRSNEGPYGAVNIIKRLWVKEYLLKKLDIDESIFRKAVKYDSIPEIAEKNILSEKEKKKGLEKSGNPYVAVIAMDGDEMGKWISGAKNPLLADQICENARNFLGEDALKGIRRPVSPAFHLQFSEALANFATHIAGKVVEHYDGQLIYAGGDDVLAVLPATRALTCARALRALFRGKASELPEEENKYPFHIDTDGFVKADAGYPLMVPGTNADVSCGIAVAHSSFPLQHMVKEAQNAEKRAKTEYGRAAFAVSLLKRGGETVYWGAKWKWSAVELFENYTELRRKDIVSARFPYALAELLCQYRLGETADDSMYDIIIKETEHVMERQNGAQLKGLCIKYLDELTAFLPEKQGILEDYQKLFLTAAFIDRDRGE